MRSPVPLDESQGNHEFKEFKIWGYMIYDIGDEYRGAGHDIHGDDEESVEIGENVPVDEEYRGMKSENELCENVGDDERDDEIDTGDDYVAPALAE